ncbi:unnamed protein product [Linum tenue]|uniref:Squalene monooxygenase n=1 Tax=Linum tenue TaxID=586396 RepID=A0AAV0I7M4_9ROSI|nr:unnamed protein product [Linum tenue]
MVESSSLLGWILASILGLLGVYFYSAARRNVEANRRRALSEESSDSVRNLTTTKGEHRSGGDANADADVIIVGAGVAGAALAHTLGKDGRKVHVIERDLTEPDRIVGELLQPGGYLKLIELGLQDCVEGIDAQRVFGYALFKDGKHTQLAYPLEKFHSDVSGRSFHNGRVQYKNKDGEQQTAYAPLTIVCDGCFSNLRRSLCNPKVKIDPSPILFYPISSTEVRCLVDVPGQKVPSISNGEMTTYLKTVVAPQVH